MPLRRAGTVPSSGVRYGPGSAAHRYALRCVRGTPLTASLHARLLRLHYLEVRRELVEQAEQLTQFQRIARDRDVAAGDAAEEGALLQRNSVERGAGELDP